MNFELPYGFNITLGFNSFNFVFGFMTQAEFAMLSGILGLVMNLILFLTKTFLLLYKGLREDAKDEETEAFARTCPECKNVYETTSVTQVFCSPECRQIFNADAFSRKP